MKADESLPHLLLNFCREIASGMAYLSSKSFIHRDLAARNVLLSAQMTCKVRGVALCHSHSFIINPFWCKLKFIRWDWVFFKKNKKNSSL